MTTMIGAHFPKEGFKDEESRKPNDTMAVIRDLPEVFQHPALAMKHPGVVDHSDGHEAYQFYDAFPVRLGQVQKDTVDKAMALHQQQMRLIAWGNKLRGRRVGSRSDRVAAEPSGERLE